MKPKVWFTSASEEESTSEINAKTKELLQQVMAEENFISKGDFTAIKLHFGEKGNDGFVKPDYLTGMIDLITQHKGKPFFTDTNTLYKGERDNSIDHANQAHEHGFTPDKVGIPVIIADGLLSKNYTPVEVSGKHFSEVNIANDLLHSDALISIAHITGHPATGLGGTLKNIGMGSASRSGKQQQHADVRPRVNSRRCVGCGECVEWCPTEAISLSDGKAQINRDKCYGCAECIATCRHNALSISWAGSNKSLQEKMAEYASGLLTHMEGKYAFFNYLLHVTRGCDCNSRSQKPVIEDLGILASWDPVAVDQAASDLLSRKNGRDFIHDIRSSSLDYTIQLEHAESLGLGTTDYELVNMDTD